MNRYNFVKSQIDRIESEGYGLNLESLLSRTFNIYKKSFFQLSLVMLLYTFALVFTWFLMFEFIYGVEFVELIEMAQDDPSIVNGVMANIDLSRGLIYSAVLAVATAIVSPIFAGVNKLAYQIHNDRPFSIGDLFAYYKQPYFSNIFVFSLILAFVVQFLGVVLMQVIPQLASIASIWIQIFLNVSLIFVIPLIVFGDMKWVEAMKASFKISFKNWFFLLFVLGIGLILSYLGILLCGVGIIFTYPFFYVLIFVIYDDVIGFEEEKDLISEIGEI